MLPWLSILSRLLHACRADDDTYIKKACSSDIAEDDSCCFVNSNQNILPFPFLLALDSLKQPTILALLFLDLLLLQISGESLIFSAKP